MKFAVVQVRGVIGTSKKIKDSLKMLKLYRKNSCVILENNPVYIGMLNKLKDFITWGEINEETLFFLLKNRGRIVGNKLLTDDYLKGKLNLNIKDFAASLHSGKTNLKDIPGLKPYFRLCPPVMGYERAGIKKPYSMGGALGYRKNNINELIKRMI